MILDALGFLRFTWIDIIDIILVAVIIFTIFRWIRGSSAINIFIAVIFLLLMRVIAVAVGMKMMSSLLGAIIDAGVIGLIVIFQPEIRRFLNNIGRKAGDTIEKRTIFQRLLQQKGDVVGATEIDEIAQACMDMSEQKTGALILIRRTNSLEDVIASGDSIDAEISSRLIMNIFFKNSPLHDGAMVIGHNRILAARCTLPITERTDLPARYGMRHKAAIGISEQSDTDVVVVSEQTGGISFIRSGHVTKVNDINRLKLLLGESAE